MVKKFKKTAAADDTSSLGATIKESAQQIWLAGLGAFSKAQEEGTKGFETLVKEGLSLQRKTQAVAEERISEATNRMSDMANGISSKAQGQWYKLENIFEERVSKAMGKLGMPNATELASLNARVDALEKKLGRATSAAASKTPAPKTAVTRKPRVRKAAAAAAAAQ